MMAPNNAPVDQSARDIGT